MSPTAKNLFVKRFLDFQKLFNILCVLCGNKFSKFYGQYSNAISLPFINFKAPKARASISFSPGNK